MQEETGEDVRRQAYRCGIVRKAALTFGFNRTELKYVNIVYSTRLDFE